MEVKDWSAATREQKLAWCKQLEHEFGGAFCGFRTSPGADKFVTARFNKNGLYFRYVPSGTYSLGYDLAKPQTVQERQLIENLGEKEKAHARGHLSQPRTVELAHFLVAERSMDMTVMIETDQRVEPPPEIRVAHPHLGERATQRREGTLPVREAREKLMKQGLDLSSEDQWEVAAALGKPYLFRWKKIPNFDFYPSSTRSNMINRRAWVKRLQAGGILDDDSAKFLIGNEIWPPFRRHLAANELGLKLGSPFNRGELCREGFLKGGDGGEAECGGYDSFYAWLPLSPFFRESSNSWEAGDVRPVIDSKRN